MTKTYQQLVLWVVAIFAILPFQLKAFQELPTDPTVKIGQLENGLTYYLRPNSLPENRIEFRLAVKAGSVLEDDDQQGLAHFTEHMLFNGTENFQKNELIDFLQKMGLEFGGDLNAYTSFDETVYILPIPTDNPENLKKAMLVLSDWAHNATFDNEEIDKERGVVMEEWRLRLGAYERMRQQIWPITLAGSRYAERLPIGQPEVLENFKYEAAKRYYKDWYRPDLMGLIAVGDFDLNEMEALVKEYFGDIPAPKNPRERNYYSMPDFEGTRVAIASDDEATGNSISVNFIQPGTDEMANTKEDLRESLVNSLFSQMINQRLRELVQSENPPFQFSYSGYRSAYGKDKFQYSINVNVKDDQFARGLEAALKENERVRRYGFTEGEMQRAKASFLNSIERQAKESDKLESWRLVGQYNNHFLNGGPLINAEQTLAFAEEVLPGISIEEVNGLIKKWWHYDNRTIEVTAKSDVAASIPSADEMIAMLDNVKNDKSIEPYEEEKIATALISSKPKAGKIVSEEKDEITEITKLTLSNGIEVYVKPTDFKNDEIRLSAFSFGGSSLYADEDYRSASNAASIIGEMGIGEFSSVNLSKFLTGKTASVRPYIGSYEEGLTGISSVKDFETFLQLIHLYFTDVRVDESAFKSWRSRLKNQYANFAASPDFQFQQEYSQILYGDNIRVGIPTPESFDAIDLERSVEIYKERFSNAGDFSFVMVGNIDLNVAKPLLETYLGSLPSTGKKETYKDVGIQVRKGQIDEEVYVGVDDKSQVLIVLSGEYDYTLENNGLMNAIANILSNKMIETLREEMGGVYGVGASASPSEYPKETFTFTISFPCKPENVEALTQAALAELEKIKNGEFSDEDVQKIVTARMQNFDEQIKQNSYWSSMMPVYIKGGENMEQILSGNERAKQITKQAIVAKANEYLTKENMIKVVKLPEGYKKGELQQEIKKN